MSPVDCLNHTVNGTITYQCMCGTHELRYIETGASLFDQYKGNGKSISVVGFRLRLPPRTPNCPARYRTIR